MRLSVTGPHRRDEGVHERRQFAAERGAFGLKERADEKRMNGHGQLGGADFAGVVEGGEAQAGALECGAVRGLRP